MFELIVSDSIRYGHLLAIAVGLGTAAQAEVSMIRGRRNIIRAETVSDLNFRHRIIVISLIGMWITGLALVALRTGFRPDAITPKLWAKLAVVALLTLNAMMISRLALPLFDRCKGRRMIDIGPWRKLAFLLFAGISNTSWLIALSLGSSLLVKTAPAQVFLSTLPYLYGAGIVFAAIVGLYVLRLPEEAMRPPARSTRDHARPLTVAARGAQISNGAPANTGERPSSDEVRLARTRPALAS